MRTKISYLTVLLIFFRATLSIGALDSSFHSPDGFISFSGSEGNSRFYAHSVSTQDDGKTIALFNTSYAAENDEQYSQSIILRIDSEGFLDSSFGQAGTVSIDGAGSGLAVRKDGKIVIATQNSSDNGTEYSLVRLNSNGTYDASFGESGVTAFQLEGIFEGIALSIQDNGNIVLLVNSNDADSTARGFSIVRLDSSGTIDTSFGTDGIIDLNGDAPEAGIDLASNSDGSLLILSNVIEEGPENYFAGIRITKLAADGTIDASFGTGGSTIMNGFAAAIATQADNRILVTGNSVSDNAIITARLNPDGSLDSTFGDNGVSVTDVGSNVLSTAMDLQDGSGIFILCNREDTESGSNEIFIIKLKSNGIIDDEFGPKGIFTPVISDRASAYGADIISKGGKILVFGDNPDAPYGEVFIAGLNGSNENTDEPANSGNSGDNNLMENEPSRKTIGANNNSTQLQNRSDQNPIAKSKKYTKVTSSWRAVITIDGRKCGIGKQKEIGTATLKQRGKKVTGSFITRTGKMRLSKGIIKGKSLKGTVSVKVQGGKAKGPFSVKLYKKGLMIKGSSKWTWKKSGSKSCKGKTTFKLYRTFKNKLTLRNNGGGRVTSSPAGIYCSSNCSRTFTISNGKTPVVKLSATPFSGYSFIKWSGGGCSGRTSRTCKVTLDKSRSVRAIFEPISTLTIQKIGEGTVTGSGINCNQDCSHSYAKNTTVALKAVPSAGSLFLGWLDGNCNGSSSSTCNATIDSSQEITAVFVTPLTSGVTVTDQLSNYQLYDFFRIIIPEAGKVSINFTNTPVPNASVLNYWEVRLTDSSGNEYLYSKSYLEDSGFNNWVGLPAGTYYVKVTGKYMAIGKPYNIRADFLAGNAYEVEFNNSTDTADPIAFGNTYSGNIQEYSSGSDSDLYTIKVLQAGKVSINFTNAPVQSSTLNAWHVRLIDSAGQEYMYRKSYLDESGFTELVDLPADSYYIKVTAAYSAIGKPYSIRAD